MAFDVEVANLNGEPLVQTKYDFVTRLAAIIMNNQDERIIQMSKQVYQKNKSNFEDICFTLFICPFCEQEKFAMTLMPIVNKEVAGSNNMKAAHKNLLSRIYKAEFDFLHEKFNCDCVQNGLYELKRVIYCYFHDGIDYHNYIDYPFEYIFTHKTDLSDQNRRLLFFDTETTGLPKNWKASYKHTENWPRLVQIAWIISDDNSVLKYNISLDDNGTMISFRMFRDSDDSWKIDEQDIPNWIRVYETEFNNAIKSNN